MSVSDSCEIVAHVRGLGGCLCRNFPQTSDTPVWDLWERLLLWEEHRSRGGEVVQPASGQDHPQGHEQAGLHLSPASKVNFHFSGRGTTAWWLAFLLKSLEPSATLSKTISMCKLFRYKNVLPPNIVLCKSQLQPMARIEPRICHFLHTGKFTGDKNVHRKAQKSRQTRFCAKIAFLGETLILCKTYTLSVKLYTEFKTTCCHSECKTTHWLWKQHILYDYTNCIRLELCVKSHTMWIITHMMYVYITTHSVED